MQRVTAILAGVFLCAFAGCKDRTLPEAAESGDTAGIERLLQTNGDINELDDHSWTALQWAVMKGNKEDVELLLAHRADPNFAHTAEGKAPPLHIAIVQGRMDLVELLLLNGARIEFTKERIGALGMAVLAGQLEIAELLLDQVGEVDFDRLLMPAVASGQTNMASLIMARGAKINGAVSPSKETALFEAVRVGNLDMVRFLVENGADVNAKDLKGTSPLALSQGMGQTMVTDFLVAHGAERSNE